MEPRAIFERVAATEGDAVFDYQEAAPREVKEGPRDPCFRARPARIVEVMRDLRDAPELRFDFLQNLTAVDWIKRDVMEIVYHLYSYPHRHAVCVKVDVPRATPRLPSVAAIWPTANWLEREQYDLLGVVFEGHPDLRRILMPDDWVGHPMRKDFREPRSYRGMPTSRPSPMELLATYDRAHVEKADIAAADIAAKGPREKAGASPTGTEGWPAPPPPPDKPRGAS